MPAILRRLPLSALLCLLLLGCSVPLAGKKPAQPVALKVVTQPYLGYAPYFIAREEGYFAEQGLQVEFVNVTAGSDTIAPVIQGNVDAAGSSVNAALFNAIAQGADLRIVAGRSYLPADGCTYSGFVARRQLVESGELASLPQLKGRHMVRQQEGAVEDYRLQKLLDLAGLSTADLELVDVPSAALLDAFEKGTIDVAGTTEPWITRLVAGGHAVLWQPAQTLMPDFQIALTIYGPNLLKKDPDAGRRFAVALLEGIAQYNQGKTERNMEIVARYTELDKDTLNKACWPAVQSDGTINAQSLVDFEDWAVANGYLDKAVTPEQFWDGSFVEYANRTLGKATP